MNKAVITFIVILFLNAALLSVSVFTWIFGWTNGWIPLVALFTFVINFFYILPWLYKPAVSGGVVHYNYK